MAVKWRIKINEIHALGYNLISQNSEVIAVVEAVHFQKKMKCDLGRLFRPLLFRPVLLPFLLCLEHVGFRYGKHLANGVIEALSFGVSGYVGGWCWLHLESIVALRSGRMLGLGHTSIRLAGHFATWTARNGRGAPSLPRS